MGENSSDYLLLSLTLNGIIPRDIESGKGKFPAEFNTYQEVHKNDLIFCLFDIDETPRTIGLSEYFGMITGAYNVARCNKEIDAKYVYYYYLSVDEYKGLKPFYTGLRKVVRTETFLNIEFALPSLKEQIAIANFLDNATCKIDTLIQKQQNLIELLKEKRQALISHVVTKGLNPHVEMKDSGIAWLGEVPEHWEVTKLKFVGKSIIGLTYSPNDITDEHNGILVLRSSNVQNKKITFDDNVYVNSRIPRHLLTQKGDILICSRNGSRALIGKSALVDENSKNLTFGAFMTIFRTTYYRYIFWVLNSSIFDFQSATFLTATINQLTTTNLNNFDIPFTSFKEQQSIANFLDNATCKIDILISKAQKAIELLKERRTALISAVVTGKIDVRECAGDNSNCSEIPNSSNQR